MTVSWVRLGPSYGQLPNEVRQLNELARESDRFRRAGDEMDVDVACFFCSDIKAGRQQLFFTHHKYKYTLQYCFFLYICIRTIICSFVGCFRLNNLG